MTYVPLCCLCWGCKFAVLVATLASDWIWVFFFKECSVPFIICYKLVPSTSVNYNPVWGAKLFDYQELQLIGWDLWNVETLLLNFLVWYPIVFTLSCFNVKSLSSLRFACFGDTGNQCFNIIKTKKLSTIPNWSDHHSLQQSLSGLSACRLNHHDKAGWLLK